MKQAYGVNDHLGMLISYEFDVQKVVYVSVSIESRVYWMTGIGR